MIQWLRDELKLIPSAAESEFEARKVDNTNGVYVVPAFTGLGAPYWDSNARGVITGLTRGANKSHIVRAALESIAYQSLDVIFAMKNDVGTLCSINVDGGASANDFLMQFQCDITDIPLVRPLCVESTALGAASLAGLYTGFYESLEYLKNNRKIDRVFSPKMDDRHRNEIVAGWHNAVNKSLTT